MHHTQEPVSAVIPAYNEEYYIGAVLDALICVDALSRILVVDDGSTDATCDVVRRYSDIDPRVTLLSLEHNLGKGGAMVAGAEAVAEDLVLFLDADLIGLKPEHVRALCLPVSWGECTMTLGLFKGGRTQTDLSHWLTPFLSGQRCLRWSLFTNAPEIGQARWGVEVALSLYAWHHNFAVKKIYWQGVTHAMRAEKMKGLRGYWSHAQMWLDIARYFSRYFIFQNVLGRTPMLPPASPVDPAQPNQASRKRQRVISMH